MESFIGKLLGSVQTETRGAVAGFYEATEKGEDPVNIVIAKQDPWERVRRLVDLDPITNQPYIEGYVVDSAVYLSSVTIAGVAFKLSAPNAKYNYVTANAVTTHSSNFQGKRKAMDAYFLGGMRRALKYGIITYLFTKSFLYSAQAIELYRCKTSIVNYTVPGALIGGVSRFILGPRAMMAGAALGGYAGAMTGLCVTHFLKWRGWTLEERLYEEVKQKLEDISYHRNYSSAVKQRLEGEMDSVETNTDTKTYDEKKNSNQTSNTKLKSEPKVT